jgi:hypothetical protein
MSWSTPIEIGGVFSPMLDVVDPFGALLAPVRSGDEAPAYGTPEWWFERLLAQISGRVGAVTMYEAYYRGFHRLTFATTQFRDVFGALFSNYADNWCQLVVDAAAERLRVEGFRFGARDEPADQAAWDIWQPGRDQQDGRRHAARRRVRGVPPEVGDQHPDRDRRGRQAQGAVQHRDRQAARRRARRAGRPRGEVRRVQRRRTSGRTSRRRRGSSRTSRRSRGRRRTTCSGSRASSRRASRSRRPRPGSSRRCSCSSSTSARRGRRSSGSRSRRSRTRAARSPTPRRSGATPRAGPSRSTSTRS